MNLRSYFPALRSALGYGIYSPAPDDLRRIEMTQHLAKRLGWIPWLRMIAIGNSVAMYGSGEDSDIDIFIVTEPDRIWLVRTLLTVWVALFSRRKTRDSHRDSFCLSFFVTTSGLDFSTFALENDVYLAYWMTTLKPIWDPYGTYGFFLDANHWHTVSAEEQTENTKYLLDVWNHAYRERFAWLWKNLNTICRAILLPHTLRSYEKLGRPYGIRVWDDILKFHDDDRRIELRDAIVD